MAYDEKKLLNFKNSIIKQAQENSKKLIEEALTKKEEELKNLEQQTLEEIFSYMQNEIKNIKAYYEHELTKEIFNFKKQTLAFRNELIDKIYEICINNIKNFTKSEEYKEYLINKVEKIALKNNCENIKILIKKEDLVLKENLLNLQNVSDVQVDYENKLGGFKILDLNNNIEIDESFSSILDEAMKNFYENSKLNLKNFWNKVDMLCQIIKYFQ